MSTQSASRTLAFATLLAIAGGAIAGDDRDPDNGQSWLTKLSTHEAREGELLSGTIRATDDFGATHDRDFRLVVTGEPGGKERKAVLHRFEPECFQLAPAARLTLEDYCDQLTVTWDDGDARIAFSSLDANRRYQFTLRADPRSPGEWTSLDPGIPAPKLHLSTSSGSHGIAYRWELASDRASYRQAGEVTAEQLRGTELHPLEAGLMGLGEVLLTFNRYAFERAILPRDHPEYQPTPYALWAEETVEGGCIYNFCFGNLGGNGGGAGNNSNTCTPSSPSYNPALCPYDITYASWPVGARPKLQKVDDDNVRFHFFLKNVGPGIAYVEAPSFNQPPTAYASLIRLGSSTPVVPANAATGTYCHAVALGMHFEIVDPFVMVDLDPGELNSMGMTPMSCEASSARPEGRYRLFIHIDPQDAVDQPGYAGNNIGNSGLFDWVRLRD